MDDYGDVDPAAHAYTVGRRVPWGVIPAIECVGYQRAMVFRLGLMAGAALLTVPAARLPSDGVTHVAS